MTGFQNFLETINTALGGYGIYILIAVGLVMSIVIIYFGLKYEHKKKAEKLEREKRILLKKEVSKLEGLPSKNFSAGEPNLQPTNNNIQMTPEVKKENSEIKPVLTAATELIKEEVKPNIDSNKNESLVVKEEIKADIKEEKPVITKELIKEASRQQTSPIEINSPLLKPVVLPKPVKSLEEEVGGTKVLFEFPKVKANPNQGPSNIQNKNIQNSQMTKPNMNNNQLLNKDKNINSQRPLNSHNQLSKDNHNMARPQLNNAQQGHNQLNNKFTVDNYPRHNVPVIDKSQSLKNEFSLENVRVDKIGRMPRNSVIPKREILNQAKYIDPTEMKINMLKKTEDIGNRSRFKEHFEDYQENPNQPLKRTINEVNFSQNVKNDFNESSRKHSYLKDDYLEEVSNKIKEDINNDKPIAMSNYEKEQEEQAIISYAQLASQVDSIKPYKYTDDYMEKFENLDNVDDGYTSADDLKFLEELKSLRENI